MNLSQGAVSKAILGAAGPPLQNAVQSKAGVTSLPDGDVVITDGFRLGCRKVFHAVCPYWDGGAGQAEGVRFLLHSLSKQITTTCNYSTKNVHQKKPQNVGFML